MIEFDPINTICVNVASHTPIQLFFISEKYCLDFEKLVGYKKYVGNGPQDFTGKIWIDLRFSKIIAIEYINLFGDFVKRGDTTKYVYSKRLETDDNLAITTDKLQEFHRMPQIKTPKQPKGIESVYAYAHFKSKGYDLSNDYYDKFLSGDAPKRKERKESIESLTEKMMHAVSIEDYETAAIIRDKIKSMA